LEALAVLALDIIIIFWDMIPSWHVSIFSQERDLRMMEAAEFSETSICINRQQGIRVQTTMIFMAEVLIMAWFREHVGERPGWINYRSEFPDHNNQFLETAPWW